jgi:phage shock protein C
MSQHYNRDHSGPYRSRNGLIFGVCRGLADYFDFSTAGMRVIIVLAFLLTGLYPVGIAYVVAGLVMKLEPVLALQNERETEFYNSYTTSRPMALSRLRDTFDSLDKRIQRMESIVTARDYDWDQRLRNG